VGCDFTNGVDLAMVILEKIGNSYGTVGGLLARLLNHGIPIVYSGITGIHRHPQVKKTCSRTWLTPMFVPNERRKLCGTRMIFGEKHGMVGIVGMASLFQVLGWRRLKSWTVDSGRHWSSRLGSKPFAEISPKALTASGKTGGKPGACLWRN